MTNDHVADYQGGIVGKISAYIVQNRDQVSSQPARDAALKCIFDLVGATAVGVEDVGPKAIRSIASSVFGMGAVPIWFTGKTSSVLGAAWANSSASAALDLDDGNRFARGHPGAAIIPAVLAVAHELNSSLEEIITAIVIGYEVGVAVGAARTTYGSSGTWTPFGVVAAVSALRRTPWQAIEHALAIAGESAPSQAFAGGPAPRVPAPEGAAVKEGIPWSVVTGITAVLLAEAGHTGPRNILDSVRHYSFPGDYAPGTAQHICGTYFKPYACCRHIHAPLAALETLMARHSIAGVEIERMEVEIHSAGLRISNRPDPANLIDVQYSIPFCLALFSLFGAQSLIPVTPDFIRRAEVVDLAGKVDLSLSGELDAVYPEQILARVTITAKGRRFVSDPTPPQGEPLMTWEELDAKFKMATRLTMSPANGGMVVDAIVSMRNGELASLLTCLSRPLPA
ncbi:MmgE/PrpD family protein [Agrobacterium vaccinii]|uniref:MmgE/PrpD family protein n=1 Tax=Agrobacterium vaccinii TaxID=2735528 RepID=UPI001E2ADAEB|nr:MmgE/PrpD family protein [Agrobacterium vaccinii]UHS59820.1 MmgE/PrpD family protein [Agrobacterium vaccinii]